MVWQIRPVSLLPRRNALNTRDATSRHFMHEERNPMPKIPNQVQKQTGVYKYPKLNLPPVQQIPLQPTIAPVRPAPAPLIPANGPSRPLGPMTNTPNQVRK
jgi:hypothetical protein